jgi:hypothetical protein
LSKPPIDRSEQFASLLQLALLAPEPRQAHCGAQLEAFRLLLLRDGDSGQKSFLGGCRIHRIAPEPRGVARRVARLTSNFETTS